MEFKHTNIFRFDQGRNAEKCLPVVLEVIAHAAIQPGREVVVGKLPEQLATAVQTFEPLHQLL
eukprot:4590051-Pleurochrysis_carterae.AAC.1